MFQVKTAEELKTLGVEELASYYNEKNTHDKEVFEKELGAKATKEDLDKFQASVLKSQEEQMKSLNTLLKDMGVRLAKKESESVASSENNLASLLKEKEADLKKLKDSSSAADNVKFEVKAVGDMSLTGNITGQIPQAERLPGYNDTPSRRVRLLDVVQSGNISSNVVEWVYKANEEGAAGQTAEGILKNQIDFDLLVGSEKVEKTTAFITVTDEMLDDVSFIRTAIDTELTREILKKVEQQVYGGTGVSPQMNGITTVASAFAAGAFAGTVDNANEVDVLVVAMNQIRIAQEDNVTNYIFMHPTDVTALKLVKVSSTDKRYVERLAMIGGALSLDGVPIIETTLVPTGEYLVGDFSKAFVLSKQSLTIEVGYNADNFVKNFKTIRAEWRGVTYVKHNDRTAFVNGVFATDKAALETA
jgi:HK97 family phage major capsid protein